MRRALALLVALAALGPAIARAGIAPYSEGPGEAPSVRPVDGVNTWYWEARNDDAGRPMAVCFRYGVDDGQEYTPYDGSPYQLPQPGKLPNGCDGAHPLPPGKRVTYHWRKQFPHRARVRWCAVAYLEDLTGWWRQDGSETCSTVRIDSEPPVIGIVLTDRRGRQGATNDPTGLRRTIGYADDTSPAWGDTRICRVTDRACQNNGLDPFDYERDCSDEPRALSTTFHCGWAWPLADARVYQCALSFDSAYGDRPPDLEQPPSDRNPDYSPAGTGNFAFACGTLVIDRSPPRLELRTEPRRPRAGQRVRLTVRSSDGSIKGPIGPYRFDFGDGSVVASPSRAVRHAYAEPGNYRVVIAAPDAAGNRGLTITGLTIGSRARLSVRAPARITRARRALPIRLAAGHAGRARLALVRGTRTLATRTLTVREPGAHRHSLRLPRLRTGRYRLRATFMRSGAARVSERASATVRVVRRR